MKLKHVVKAMCPEPVLAAYQWMRLARHRQQNATRCAAEVFAEIYERGLWGKGDLHSGHGSRGAVVDAYVKAVLAFIREHAIRTIVDLGCGDFHVGKQLVGPGISYTGVDVVPAVIEHNRRLYGSPLVSFVRGDICIDPLPDGDLCLVRQVFQHLSNAEIAAALPKLRKYRHVIVTEHQPASRHFRGANLDKPHGADTRIPDGSAVRLSEPPFCIPTITLLQVEVPGTLGETLLSSVAYPNPIQPLG